jgi:hypothetical protein
MHEGLTYYHLLVLAQMGAAAEGVFRKPGSETAVNRLCLAFAEGGNPWLRDEDVDDVSLGQLAPALAGPS